MERTLPLKPQDQATRFRHFRGVILDGFPYFQGLMHFLRGNISLEHTLNSMDTKKEFGIVQLRFFLQREDLRMRQFFPKFSYKCRILIPQTYISNIKNLK